MNNRFYIYVYLDQRKPGTWMFRRHQFEFQPFYVGKGTGKRDILHLCPYMLRHKTHKSSTIKAIITETGEIPLHRRIEEKLTSEQATELEKEFIKTFGRRDIGTGVLCNHTDGGDGSSNMPEESRRRININRRRSIYQYTLNGRFLKKWASVTDVGEYLNITETNIGTSIKRKGTCAGFIWSYEYLGRRITPKNRYQMPIQYESIKQILNGKVVAIHSNALEAALTLNLTNKQARCKILDCIKGKLKTAYGYKWSL